EGIVEGTPEGTPEGEGEGTIEYRIVPDVVGLPQAEAINEIVTANLAIGSVSQQCSDTIPAGNVISQNPSAGQQVPIGTPISIVTASGPCMAFDAWIDSPEYIVKMVGDTLSLKVIVVGARGEVAFQWYFSHLKNLKSPEIIDGATTDTLYLEDLQLEDSGFYWCQVADDYDVIDTPLVELHVITGLSLNINFLLVVAIGITTSVIFATRKHMNRHNS
ncbi:MAG TPA: PASTA domain-containing protein, partial [Candidatus Hydrogenedens sp.]|nr:PASTA domain-containing protein [Candidatus Hydrogenedens sp.]